MKYIVLLALFIGSIGVTSAQEFSKNALGLRLGDSDGFGAEISYQTALSDSNRLELDFGWRDGNSFDGFKLVGLYQWVMPLGEKFNWFVGAGAGFGSYEFKNDNNDKETFLLAAGDIGLEYNLNIPLMISLDFRPEFGFGDFRDDLDLDIALGIRYQF